MTAMLEAKDAAYVTAWPGRIAAQFGISAEHVIAAINAVAGSDIPAIDAYSTEPLPVVAALEPEQAKAVVAEVRAIVARIKDRALTHCHYCGLPAGERRLPGVRVMTNKTTAEQVAIIVADQDGEAGKSNLIAGSGYAWDRELAKFGLTRDRPEAVEVMNRVMEILCRQRGVEIDLSGVGAGAARAQAVSSLRRHRDLESDVRSARALDIPEAEIAREAGISRNRVRRILARQTTDRGATS